VSRGRREPFQGVHRFKAFNSPVDGNCAARPERGGDMKKILALSVMAVLCAVVVLAGDEKMGDKKMMGGKTMEGTISKMDAAGKMMMVKDSAGKETAVYWNDTTKVAGDAMKEGSMVHWKGMEKDGKMWATWVHVGEMKHKM
jgi:hypothetical protein